MVGLSVVVAEFLNDVGEMTVLVAARVGCVAGSVPENYR